MKLDKLIAGAPSSWTSPVITADSQGEARLSCSRRCRAWRRMGATYIDGAIKFGRGGHPYRRRGRVRGAWPSVLSNEPRLALATAAAAFYPNKPADDCGGDRNERQEFDGGFPAPDLGAYGPQGGVNGHAGRDRSVGRASISGHTTPDPVADSRDAGQARARRRDASGDGSVERMGSRSIRPAWREAGGGRIHQPDAGPSRLSKRFRTTTAAAPRCGCSPSCCPRAQPAVDQCATARSWTYSRRLSKAAGLKSFTVGWRGRDLRIS